MTSYGEHWVDTGAALAVLPGDRPFLRGEAREVGVSDHILTRLVGAGWLRRPLAGVYVSHAVGDSLALRLECLRLVVPEDAVVTDRTAAWLWGVSMALAPLDNLVVPRVSVFRPRGYRLRNGLAASGSRDLTERDVSVLPGGIRATTPLRTACDLGRLLSRDQALAALDGLARDGGVDKADLQGEVDRFRGHRGVRQLRTLAPLVDPRSQSPGESILRLRWLDCALPTPEPQLEVVGPSGPYFLDLGLRRPRMAAEYDGEAWHGEDDVAYDKRRRRWIELELGFVVCVVRHRDLYGAEPRVEGLLRDAYDLAMSKARLPRHRINDQSA